jgi:hypothetical protein
MAILTWPNIDAQHSICIICRGNLALDDATIASEYTDGRPALAHNTHRDNKIEWLEACMSFERSRPIEDTLKVSVGFKDVELYIEPRHVDDPAILKSDLSWHVLTRSIAGKTLIVTNHPIEFLSTMRKHWKKITKQLHIERARTLYEPKKSNLDLALERLHSLSFSGSVKYQDVEILVLSTDDLTRLDSPAATAYVCHPLTEIQRLAISKVVSPAGAIVDYFTFKHSAGD